MSKQEAPRPNWNEIVAPIIKVKLAEAQVARTKAEEVVIRQKEAEGRSILYAQEYKARIEGAIAKRWELLESLHVRELLEDLNASQNIWRGLGTIKKNQLTARDSSEGTAVEFSLEVDYIRWGSRLEDTGGFGEQAGYSSVPCREASTTYTKVGITPAGNVFRSGDEDKQAIRLQYMNFYLKGTKFLTGDVLYVMDQEVGLYPIEGANTFDEGDMSLIKLRDPRRSPYHFEYEPGGVFLIEAEHPKASEILTEVLKRSCIHRAGGNLLPFQLVEKGTEIMREAELEKQPVQRPKGFLGRLFG